MEKIVIYTDGSCLGNPGPGGWAAIIQYKGKEVVLKGGEPGSTNNRMEMTAVLESLKWLNKNAGKELVEIYSDSSLVIKSLKLGWKRKANIDIWTEMDKALEKVKDLKISWHWVKGHADNIYNQRVDELAVEQSMKIEKKAPAGIISVEKKEKSDGYFCHKCNKNVLGRLSYNAQADMIRVDCENCGSYIKFAEVNVKNLKEAKKRVLATKKQIEAIKKIKEDQGEKLNEKQLKQLTTDQANIIINSAQTLWD